MIQQVMNMNIADKFNKGKTVLSFEVFPPKKTSPVETIYGTLEKLVELRSDLCYVIRRGFTVSILDSGWHPRKDKENTYGCRPRYLLH